MLYLDIGVTSSVVVTLYENCQNQVNPFFSWHIQDADTKQQYVFCADDFSSSPWYYNCFTFSFTGGGAIGLTAGIVPAYAGQYVYTVHEMINQYDLDLSNSMGVVETGILNIVGTYSSRAEFTQNDQNTVPVFKNVTRM